MQNSRSTQLFQEALKSIPGGVNSPVRAFSSVGSDPLFIKKAAGSSIFDEDGNSFIDFVGSWGPMILGHCHPQVVAAIKAAVDNGASFGAPTELEITLAEMVIDACPLHRDGAHGQLRHRGHHERHPAGARLHRARQHHQVLRLLPRPLRRPAGQGGLRRGHLRRPRLRRASPPTSPAHADRGPTTTSMRVKELRGGEPGGRSPASSSSRSPATWGPFRRRRVFSRGYASSARSKAIVLIFDEVMSGFRVAYGGAQAAATASRPDMTTLGKIIGGGLPVGAFGGKQEIMSCSPRAGGVYQAGTLSGNPLAMTARDRDPETSEGRRILPEARGEEQVRRRGDRQGRERSRLPALLHPRRLDVLRLLLQGPGLRLGQRSRLRHQGLRKVLPPHAGGGGLPGAVAVRDRLRLDGAQPGRAGADHRRRSQVLQGAVTRVVIQFKSRRQKRRPCQDGGAVFLSCLVTSSASSATTLSPSPSRGGSGAVRLG